MPEKDLDILRKIIAFYPTDVISKKHETISKMATPSSESFIADIYKFVTKDGGSTHKWH